MAKKMCLIGQRYGRLIVESEAEPRITPKGRKVYYWNCICDCGNRTVASTSSLRNGYVSSCGCYHVEQVINATALDLEGQRFGRLIAKEHITKDSGSYWKCDCDCGNTTEVLTTHLTRGLIRSCGCLRKETSQKLNLKHHESKTRLYKIWKGIKERCNNPNIASYKYYGGRGIKVCDEWNNDNGYTFFRTWAISNGYKDNLTIDRIDVNGNYEPSNCRWATAKQQLNNTRRNVFIEYNGQIHTMKEWSEKLGLNYQMLHRHIHVYGWDANKALNYCSGATKEDDTKLC